METLAQIAQLETEEKLMSRIPLQPRNQVLQKVHCCIFYSKDGKLNMNIIKTLRAYTFINTLKIYLYF